MDIEVARAKQEELLKSKVAAGEITSEKAKEIMEALFGEDNELSRIEVFSPAVQLPSQSEIEDFG